MIDINKQYRTKNGREVRIYAIDGKYPFTIQGAVKTEEGEWEQQSWTDKGFFMLVDGCHNDLVEVKPRIKRTFWFNIVPETQGATIGCLSKEHADRLQAPNRIACVKVEIDCEEGEGLDQ